jgi:NAD(P)-dependent dehydrogenase (short-subunit alcohol dehydrogenase family)
MSKTGRVAVITGAAQGIGKRTAELLAERGYALLLNDLRSAAETLNAARVPAAEVLEVLGDISDEVVVDKIAAAVRERWGRTDVLVNNAGISLIAPAEKLSAAEYRRVLEINLVAPFLLAKAFGAMMLQQRSGSIINVASVAGIGGGRGPCGLQRLEARPHRSDPDTRVRMGRKRCARQCGVSGMGENRNGCCRSGSRRLYGR